MSNQQLAKELHKSIIRKFLKQIFYPSFKDNTWGVDLADIQLISKYIKTIMYLLWSLIFLVNMLGLCL